MCATNLPRISAEALNNARSGLTRQEAAKRLLSVLANRIPPLLAVASWDALVTAVSEAFLRKADAALVPSGTGELGACVYAVAGGNACVCNVTQAECDCLGGQFFPGQSC
jgi:hypothetical protein